MKMAPRNIAMLLPYAQNNAQQDKNYVNMMKLIPMVADMKMFALILDEILKVLSVIWIGAHHSALEHKPYKIMELMPLVAQLPLPVYKELI